MPTIPAGRPGSEVRDLTGDVSDGDDLPNAIQDVLDDGVQVYIPPGEYTGDHSDLDFQADDATIYGDPQGVSIDCDMDSNAEQGTSTRLRIENIDIRGIKPLEQVKIDVDCDGGTLEWVNFNFPDGTVSPSDSYVARCDSGEGKHVVKNCYFGPHGNSLFYYSQRDEDDMPVVFEGNAYHNTASAWRGGNAVLRDCIYLVDGAVPDFKEPDGDPGGPGTPRMTKFEGGGETIIENCDAYIGPNGDASGADGPCIDWGPDSTDSNTVVVRNSRFGNEIDREIFDTASGPTAVASDSSLSNVSCVTEPYFSGDSIPGDISNGDAPRTDVESRRWNPLDGSVDPGDSFDTETGSDATPPSSGSGDVWTPADGATAPDSDDESDASGTEIVLTASEANPDDDCDVSMTVEGEVTFGSESEPGTDRIETDGDGRYRATSVSMDPGAVDSYWVSGPITGYSVTQGYDVSITADGTATTFEALVDSASNAGSGAEDGSGSDSDGSDAGDSGASDGGPGVGSGSEGARLLVIDGTSDPDQIAKYDVTVSGTIDRAENHSSSVDGQSPWDTMTDHIDGSRVVGIVGNGTDVYRISGPIQSIDVDGRAGIRIVEE